MSKKGMGKFIVGAALGAGLGLLFAPKKGSETRKDLKRQTDKAIEKLKKIDKKEVVEKLNQKVQELKKDFENLNKETAGEMIREKSSALMKKADELIEVAKKKSAPVIEKAADEVKEKTIVILKNTLEKLEDKPEVKVQPKPVVKKSNNRSRRVKTTKPKTV